MGLNLDSYIHLNSCFINGKPNLSHATSTKSLVQKFISTIMHLYKLQMRKKNAAKSAPGDLKHKYCTGALLKY